MPFLDADPLAAIANCRVLERLGEPEHGGVYALLEREAIRNAFRGSVEHASTFRPAWRPPNAVSRILVGIHFRRAVEEGV
jgi:hypothetical protein